MRARQASLAGTHRARNTVPHARAYSSARSGPRRIRDRTASPDRPRSSRECKVEGTEQVITPIQVRPTASSPETKKRAADAHTRSSAASRTSIPALTAADRGCTGTRLPRLAILQSRFARRQGPCLTCRERARAPRIGLLPYACIDATDQAAETSGARSRVVVSHLGWRTHRPSGLDLQVRRKQ
jgi:hypothetical protein